MGRRRKSGRAIDGILVLDKPLDISSNRALQRARGIYSAQRAGHTGSLDPLATGVLPICFGEATKFSSFLLDADKGYKTTVTLGAETATGDAEGELKSELDASAVTEEQVRAVLQDFMGEQMQVPPMYSAIKKDGQPLYKLARQGVELALDARPVVFKTLDLIAFRAGKRAEVDINVLCSKGTYIRSLARDIGDALSVGGHVSALRRTQSGPFAESHSHSLESLQVLRDREAFDELDALLLPITSALSHLPAMRMDDECVFGLKRGQPVQQRGAPRDGMLVLLDEADIFLGIAVIDDQGRIAPKRLLAS